MIEILETAPLTSVQDLGRWSYLRYGVGCSGAMDRLALRAANILLGNAEDAAVLEIQAFPFRLRFTATTGFALTGGDASAKLDNVPVLPWWARRAEAGAVLRLAPLRQGARVYMAVAGAIDVPVVLGSRSTQFRGAFGGFEGRNLQAGDRIATGTTQAPLPGVPGVGAEPPIIHLPADWVDADSPPNTIWVRVLPAGEYGLFTEAAQQRFWDTGWKVTGQSNRAGYRLAGPPLEFARQLEMRSHGIVPGVVQVPPSGEPIIQLSDAHTAGGYPKIGTIIEADLWRVAQAPLGSRLRFVQVDYPAALTAWRENEAWLADLRQAMCVYRATAA